MTDDTSLNLRESLLIEEYKYIRSSIAKNIDAIEKTEIYVIGAIGATAVFSIAAVQDVVSISAAFICLVLALLGSLRYWGLDKSIIIDQDYISKIEMKYDDLHYTTYFRQNSKHDLRQSRYIVWFSLIIMTFCLVSYAAVNAPFTSPSAQNCPANSSSQSKSAN